MSYTPDLPEGTACAYCSATALCWDHVIPVDLFPGRRRYSRDFWLVPSCEECNRTLGFKPILNVPDRVRLILSKYGPRYRKLLQSARWTIDELDELGPSLRSSILAAELERSLADQRLTHLKVVANKPEDYLRPKNYRMPS